NGCSASQQVIITIPTAINVTATGNNILCSGQNGSIVFSASGGTGIITYKVNGVTATSPYAVTVAGSYNLLATDANGCTSSKQVVITALTSTLSVTATGTDPVCNGQNGSIIFSATGGTGTIVYRVNNVVATSPYAVSASGVYTITATDASGCTATKQVTITVPAVVNLTAIGINPSCPGQNGSIIFFATGGSGIFTYKINNDAARSPFTTAPSAGTYVVKATDSKGCYVTKNVTITIPTAITLTVTGTSPTCGGTNGTITFSATGGTGTLSYKVNNATATSPYAAAASGTYSVVATDAKGCNVTKSVTIAIPSSINLSATGTNPNCSGQNGSIAFSATGGTGTLTYKVNNVTTTSPFAATTSGTYTILATDTKGCTSTKQVVIAIPTAIVLTATAASPKCSVQSGSIVFSATGGTGSITYKVNNVAAVSPFATSISGSYTVLATDTKGCTASNVVTITIPAAITASISTASSNVYCNSLTLTATSTGLAPLTYEWYNTTNILASTASSISLNNFNADGNYTVYVTDANKCRTATAATYNYLKQNLLGNYTILGLKDVALGQTNIVNGSIGNTAAGKKVAIDKNSTVSGFVKSPVITLTTPVTVTGGLIYSAAVVTLPTFLTNTANVPATNFTVADNVTATIASNYNSLTIGKAAAVTINGTIYGTIIIGEGAQVTFTQTEVNISTLLIAPGKLNVNYTTANFNGTAVKIKTSVVVGDRSRVNASNATFFVSDQVSDVEKFSINSNDTRFTGNIYMPKGKLQVKGTAGPVVLTGVFIAEDIASSVAATWNGNTCAGNLIARSSEASPISEQIVSTGFDVIVSPNPSQTDFKLKILSEKHEKVNIRIIDALGSVREVMTDKLSDSEIKVGAKLKSGTYFAEITKGKERKVIKLIKLN
ncbi:MAG: T9SS type A sorting domain-containing protein, partial [Bacteroidota bacterium]